MTLSTPIKIVTLAGLAVALALAGAFTLLASSHRGGAAGTISPIVKVITTQPAHAPHARSAKPKLQLTPNLPAPVRRGLERNREVVAVVYSQESAIDRRLLVEARSGARAAKVGFVALNVQNEPIASAVFGWASSVGDPAVLVVRRPGKIVFTLQGPTDRDTVAQAAANAK